MLALTLLLTLTATPLAPPGVQRALLVGIDAYAEAPPTAGPGARRWPALEGAVRDAELMRAVLVERGANPAHLTLLTDADATREGILGGIRTLIAAARPGDHLVFFYAGHGSQVVNTASEETDGRDESIVPHDGPAGAPDIRDKELRRLWNAALDAVGPDGSLTVIQDNCHSGSGSRGPVGGAVRRIALDPSQSVADGAALARPDARGALLLSASQDDEPAREIVHPDGTTNGAFTWALAAALRGTPPGAAARTVFERAAALVQSTGLTQVPVLEGPAERALFGEATGAAVGDGISVASVEPGGVVLRGGLFQGLGVGAELVRFLTTDAAGQPLADASVRLRVTETDGARSRADLIAGDPDAVAPGDLFRVTRWVPPPVRPLRVWIGAPAPPGAWRSAPKPPPAATGNPFHADAALLFTDAGWTAFEGGARVAPDAVAGTRFTSLPLPPALHGALVEAIAPLGGVEAVRAPEAADYWLVGTEGTAAPDFRWVLARATAGDTLAALPVGTDPVSADRPADAARALADALFRLARVHAWLALDAPPDAAFPLRVLGLRPPDGQPLLGDGHVGDAAIPPSPAACGRRCLRLVLGATPAEVDAFADAFAIDRRYVYAFVIDPGGASTLLWPRTANVENDLTLPGDPALRDATGPEGEPVLTLDAGPWFSLASPPFGRYTFVLLTSQEPIPQPDLVFSMAPLRTGALRAGGSALADLLAGAGTASRGPDLAVPASWSVRRFTIDVVPTP